MRRVTLVVSLLAAHAWAQEDDLQEIARIMAEREAATYPFACIYTLETQRVWRGKPTRTQTGGALAVSSTRYRWQTVRELEATFDDGWLRAEHHPDRWSYRWRGHISDHAPQDRGPLLFGLRRHGVAFSALVRDARVLGRERLGDSDCLIVFVDAFGLWLAPEHGYFPLRVTWYDPLPGAESIEVDGQVYTPARWWDVDELATAGAARFPLRGRFSDRWKGKTQVFRLTVDRDSLRFDRDVRREDFGMPSWMKVKDFRDGRGHYWWTPAGKILTWWVQALTFVFGLLAAYGVRWRIKRRAPQEEEG